MIVFSLIVGLLGVILNFNVVRDMDWHSKPYSFYRHFQFMLAAVGATAWSYALLGAASSSFVLVVCLALVVTPALIVHYRVGGEVMCKPFEDVYKSIKYRIRMYLVR